MSEIQGELDEAKFERYTRFLNALLKVLSQGASPVNFRVRLQLELDPQINKKRMQFCTILEGSLSQEEREAKKQASADLIADLLEMTNAESFAETVLERNEINIGEDVGGRLDDPILRIFADDETYDDSKLARTTTIFTVEPRAAVYVDEFSVLFFEEISEEFKDEYQEEYVRIIFLGRLISNLSDPSSSKMDMEAFSERCELQMEDNGNLLEISGKRAAEELARSLEKMT